MEKVTGLTEQQNLYLAIGVSPDATAEEAHAAIVSLKEDAECLQRAKAQLTPFAFSRGLFKSEKPSNEELLSAQFVLLTQRPSPMDPPPFNAQYFKPIMPHQIATAPLLHNTELVGEMQLVKTSLGLTPKDGIHEILSRVIELRVAEKASAVPKK